MKLTIAIIAYNRLNLLKECLGSLLDCTKIPFSLKVVDNASTDKSVLPFLMSLAAKHRFIEVIENKANDGCGPVRFKLMNESNCDVFVSLDSDMVLTSGWEKPLIDELACRPQLGAVGPLIVKPTNIVHSNGGRIKYINSKYIRLYEHDSGADFIDDEPFVSADCEWLPGGALALRGKLARSLISAEHASYFRFGFNDAHIALLLKARGYNLATRCDSFVYHMRDKISQEEKGQYYAYRENIATLCISIMQFEKAYNLNPCFSWQLLDRLTGKSHSTIHDAEAFFGGLKDECVKQDLDVCSDHAQNLAESYINQYRQNTPSFESMRAWATSAGLNQDWSSAIERWGSLEKTFPGQSTYAQVKRAQALRHLGKFYEAESILADEIRQNKAPVYARAELAELAMAQNQWAEAVERWQELERYFPGQWRDLSYRLAISLAGFNL